MWSFINKVVVILVLLLLFVIINGRMLLVPLQITATVFSFEVLSWNGIILTHIIIIFLRLLIERVFRIVSIWVLRVVEVLLLEERKVFIAPLNLVEVVCFQTHLGLLFLTYLLGRLLSTIFFMVFLFWIHTYFQFFSIFSANSFQVISLFLVFLLLFQVQVVIVSDNLEVVKELTQRCNEVSNDV